MAENPYQKYQQQSVMTMTQGEMLKKLYDGVIKELNGAILHIKQKDYASANTSLQKAQRILNHLKVTLNFKYEISNSLSSLYDYFMNQIIQANMKKDIACLEEVIAMVTELRDAFIQADKNTRTH